MNFDTIVSSLSSVATSTTAVVLVAQNASRQGLYIVNENSAENLFLAFGATATLTGYSVKLAPGAEYEMPTALFTLLVSGIWDGATAGFARVTEISKGYF
jgi:hypothetical protein